jgi:hypothetical protein
MPLTVTPASRREKIGNRKLSPIFTKRLPTTVEALGFSPANSIPQRALAPEVVDTYAFRSIMLRRRVCA